MSTDPPKPAAVKKARSPVEKTIVWGGIVLLVGLVAVQAHARFGYEMSLKNLQSRVNSDDDRDGQPLYLNDVPSLLVGFPSKSLEEDRHWQAVTYKWQGLGKSYTIRMPYDTSEERPMILSLETSNAPEEPPLVFAAEGETAAQAAETPSLSHMGGGGPGGMPGGGGGPGGGRGGPPPDIMQSDADGDGKVSKAEAPERMARFFDRVDTNSDGYIDADEAAEMQRRRAEQQAAGGGRGGPGGGNRRPEAETAADTPADAEAAVQAIATEAKPADEKPEAKPE